MRSHSIPKEKKGQVQTNRFFLSCDKTLIVFVFVISTCRLHEKQMLMFQFYLWAHTHGFDSLCGANALCSQDSVGDIDPKHGPQDTS